MKKRIFSIVLTCVMIISTFAFTGCSGEKVLEDLPINYVHATYVIEISNPQIHVGFVDYVFVGYIEDKLDIDYWDYLPVQNYKVKVLENIKGELPINSSVEIEKCGGLSQDKKSIFMFENDILPEKDKIYIFLVMVSEEGVLAANDPYTIIPLESGINADSMKNASFVTTLSNSDILQKYINAYENEIPFERERTEYIQQD